MEGKRKEDLARMQQLMTGEEFCARMERIEASNAGQEKYAKKQYHMSQITAAASVIILGIRLRILVMRWGRLRSFLISFGDEKDIENSYSKTEISISLKAY